MKTRRYSFETDRPADADDDFLEDQPFIRHIIGSAETTFPDFPSYTLPTQPRWHKGPVVLEGLHIERVME